MPRRGCGRVEAGASVHLVRLTEDALQAELVEGEGVVVAGTGRAPSV